MQMLKFVINGDDIIFIYYYKETWNEELLIGIYCFVNKNIKCYCRDTDLFNEHYTFLKLHVYGNLTKSKSIM